MSVRNSLASLLLHTRGNYPKALELRLDNLSMGEQQGNTLYQCFAIEYIISDYMSMRDYPHVLAYGKLLDSLHRIFHHDGKVDPLLIFWKMRTPTFQWPITKWAIWILPCIMHKKFIVKLAVSRAISGNLQN